MKDEEIDIAAKNYVDTVRPSLLVSRSAIYAFKAGYSLAEEKRDEYAEEYAKAFVDFCYSHYDVDERDVDDMFKEFKESLKK